MAKQDCTRNGERISKLEVRCEEYDHRTNAQRDFIIDVNKRAEDRDELQWKTIRKHERYFNLFFGGYSALVIVLSVWVTLKQLGVIG